MKASVKNTVDQIMAAVGPVYYQVKDYETIRLATAIVMAKVILSTPDTGRELEILDTTSTDILHALEQLLQIEAAEKQRRADFIESGIENFSGLINGHAAGPALVGRSTVVEAEAALQIDDTLPEDEVFVSKKEFYENSGLNPDHYSPADGLAAINGGISPEARDAAEAFAGQVHHEVERGTVGDYINAIEDLTEDEFEQLKKEVIKLHTPDADEGRSAEDA